MQHRGILSPSPPPSGWAHDSEVEGQGQREGKATAEGRDKAKKCESFHQGRGQMPSGKGCGLC